MKQKEAYFVIVKCGACKGTGKELISKRQMKSLGYIQSVIDTGLTCCYCDGTGKRKEHRPHPSHRMSKWASEILAPCGTPRFYGVRHCTKCQKEEWKHAAGHFLHGLSFPCPGEPEPEIG